jgi:hypothetical protein
MSDAEHDSHAEPVSVASFATTGEAEVAQAALRAFGIESALDDQIEGGTVAVEGEPAVNVVVRAADAADARRILSETPSEPGQGPGA